MYMLNLPKKVYFKKGAMNVALKELDEVYGFKRAFIVSDANLYRLGIVNPVDAWVRGRGIRTAEFFTFDSVPSFENVRSGLPKMLEYNPDVIIAVGGGSVMSAAKAMWLLYENPDLDFNEVADKFSSLDGEYDANYADFPDTGKKAKLVLIATTAGSGAECSPFSVLADDNGKLRVIASYKLLPEIAVIDSMFSENMPTELVKKSGLAALSQAVRAYVAPGGGEYTQGFAREAAESILNNLEAAVSGCVAAREKMSYAASVAGLAFSNAANTVDTEAGFYPENKEKSASDIGADAYALIVDLAKHAGIQGDSDDKIFADWIAACEKLHSL